MARRSRAAYELRAWRMSLGKSTRGLARVLGVSGVTVVRVEGGTRKPSLALAARIERVTEGRVRPADWVADDTE